MALGLDEFPAENQPVKKDRPVVGGPDEADFFLDKFLDGDKPDDAAPDVAVEPQPVRKELTPEEKALQGSVVEALKEIFDPEIPVNIYELGLIYEVNVTGSDVAIMMTLTTPHCPVAESMPGEIELKAASVDGVTSARVHLVWEPPWDMSLMSDEARLELGLL